MVEKRMKLWNGRVAKFLHRTMNNYTVWVTELKPKEVKELGIKYSRRYTYIIGHNGTVERWYLGNGGPILQHYMPIDIDD